MVDPAEGTSVGGRGATEKVLEDGVPTVNTEDLSSDIVERQHDSGYWPPLTTQPTRSGTPRLEPFPDAGNPIASASDVNSVESFTVDFVADPFLVIDEKGKFHLFAEVMQRGSGGGSWYGRWDGHNPLNLTYQETTRGKRDAGNGTLNYPFTWRHEDGTWYQFDYFTDAVDLWKADSFPSSWSKVTTIINESGKCQDPTLVVADPDVHNWFGGDQRTFFLFTHGQASGSFRRHLWYSTDLTSGWTEHPSSPLPDIAGYNKQGGRPVVRPNYIRLWTRGAANDLEGSLSLQVTDLSTTSHNQVEEGQVTRESRARNWNHKRMHHVDPVAAAYSDMPIVIVDGADYDNDDWSVGAYTYARLKPYPARHGGQELSDISANTDTNVTGGIQIDRTGVAGQQGDQYHVQEDGIYLIMGTIQFDLSNSAEAKTCKARIHVNGTPETLDKNKIQTGDVGSVHTHTMEVLNEGDEVELVANYSPGGDTVRVIGQHERTKIHAVKVSEV